MEKEFDQNEIVCGSSIRRVLPTLVQQGRIQYDTTLKARNNDLVLCKVSEIPPSRGHTIRFRSNGVERCYYRAGRHTLTNEMMSKRLAISVVGSRYSSLSFVGGLYNPVTGEINGDICGGTMVVNLGRMNTVGFLNYNYGDEQPIEVEVLGVLLDAKGSPMNLVTFREAAEEAPPQEKVDCFIVTILGIDMECGKTTCARAIASELVTRGYTVTYEKKTGGPFCRDWVNVFSDRPFGEIGTQVDIDIGTYPARDFIDATGCVSSHTVSDYPEFVFQSVTFTLRFLQKMKSQFHLIEFAGNVSEQPNLHFLQNSFFKDLVDAVVYCSPQMYESAHQFVAYFQTVLGYDRRKTEIILSGEIGNEDCADMIRKEVSHRLGVPICRSVGIRDGTLIPFGKQLADQLEELRLSRRQKPLNTRY